MNPPYAAARPGTRTQMRRVVVILELSVFAWLLIAHGSRLASQLYTNQSSVHLASSWAMIAQSASLPVCRPFVVSSPVTTYAANSVEFNPLNAHAWLALGRGFWLQGDCEHAVQAWRQALSLDPADRIVQLELANALMAGGQRPEALAAYQTLDLASYFFARGLTLERRGQLQASLDWYQLSLTLEPTRAGTRAVSVKYLHLFNQPQEAIKLWRQMSTAVDVSTSDRWFALGQIAEIEHDWEGAQRAYENGSKIARDTDALYEFYSQLGVVSQQRQNFAAARQYYLQASQIKPESMPVYLWLGILAQQQQAWAEAEQWYERAALVDPSSEMPVVWRGTLLWDRGDRSRALELLRQGLTRNPRNAMALFYLGRNARAEGDMAQAIELLQQAMDATPGASLYYMITLGDWFVEARRCTEGLSVFERALALWPDQAYLRLRLSETQKACP